MCNNCRGLRKTGKESILVLKNGFPEAYDMVALEARRTNEKSFEDDVYLVVEWKKPGEVPKNVLKSFEPIHYCPFCGEKL